MKVGCLSAGSLCRGTVTGLVGLAPVKSVEYKGYKIAARDMEFNTQHLCT